MTYVKTNISGYYKDPETGVVINKNESDFKMFEAQKQLLKEKKRVETDLHKALDEINDLKSQMLEIKQLLMDKRKDSNG